MDVNGNETAPSSESDADEPVCDGSPSAKENAILDAALAKFSAYGFARTSMADIASAAGMSRPALYQHFANKEDVFRSMLERVFDQASSNALAALSDDGGLESQLDGFLQRWSGDLAAELYATEHGDDILQAKASYARPVVEEISKRLRDGLSGHLRQFVGDRAGELTELLILAPVGFKYDEPSIALLRDRLSLLAATVAAAIEAGPGSSD